MIHNIRIVSRCVIGVVLLLGSLTKWANFGWFVGVLKKYDLAPRQTAVISAFSIALLELVIGILLLVGRWLPWSAYTALGLFLVFALAISVNLVRGKFIECGCNGFWKKTRIGWQLVSRNLGLSGLAFLSGVAEVWLVSHLCSWIFVLSLALVAVPFLPKRVCHH